MRLYLDSSAIVKLVKAEPESAALRRYLRRRRENGRVTSALAQVEVVRAVAGGGPAAMRQSLRRPFSERSTLFIWPPRWL